MGNYLGVPVVHGRVTKYMYKDIMEKVHRNISQLASSVLAALPTYYMQSAKLSVSLREEIDRVVRRFIWGGCDLSKGVPRVTWEQICKAKSQRWLGLRMTGTTNKAHLGKLRWKVATGDKSLLARVVRAKYFVVGDVLNGPLSSSSFLVCRGIENGAAVEKKRAKWSIGNGQKARFWLDTWVDKRPLIEHAIEVVEEDSLNNVVGEFTHEDGSWAWDKFASKCPSSMVLYIASIPVLIHGQEANHLFWDESSSGDFAVGFAYDCTTHRASIDDDFPLELIWKLCCPQRIKFLLWRMTLDRLATNEQRYKRGFADLMHCVSCGNDIESVEHVFRHCSRAKLIWDAMVPSAYSSSFSEGCFHTWMHKNLALDHKFVGEVHWNILFAVTCSWIWKWRCDFAFGRHPIIPVDSFAFLRHQALDIVNTWVHFGLQRNVPQRNSMTNAWNRPVGSCCKLNVDGCSKGNPGLAGGGGVFRCADGSWVHGFVVNLGVATVTRAEWMTLWIGLRIAVRLGFASLHVETNFKVIECFMNRQISSDPENAGLIRVCKELMDQNVGFSISHVYREANMCADILSNLALSFPLGEHDLPAPPHLVRHQLSNDALGVGTFCNIPM